MLPKNRPPNPPVEILQKDFLDELGMTQVQLAAKMGVPVQRVNLLVNGKRGVTAETALLLSDILGTTPQFWMNLQTNHDLWVEQRKRLRHTG